jgi:putative nucleotidyltransferase with HDIG domain
VVLAGAPGELLRLAVRQAGPEIVGHSLRVARGAGRVARAYGMPAARAELVQLAGLLHDVGKSLVSRHVLHKPGPLDAGDWAEMRRHPGAGARLLAACGYGQIAAWVLAHHERPDGLGYPHRLTRAQIPIEAQMVAVADAYDAMTTARTYRPRLAHDQAVPELQRAAGCQFEAELVDAFLAHLPRRRRAA